MSNKQKTIASPVSFSGQGLHTGVAVDMTVLPAEAGHGIKFCRVDLADRPVVPALAEFVVDTSRSTTLGVGEARISTVEHIMAALWTMGVDNALVEINNIEVPIMDGSAREFVEAIGRVGLTEQQEEIRYYQVTEKLSYDIPEKEVRIEIWPDEGFSAMVHVDFGSRVLGSQFAVFEGEGFEEGIAPCRTFVFLHELEQLLAAGLIKGGDVKNAIVVVEDEKSVDIDGLKKLFNKPDIEVRAGYLSNTELHFYNEPARHKLLDVLGDFALLGVRIKGKIVATRPGHFANTEMAKTVRKAMKKEGPKPVYRYNPNVAPIFDVNEIKLKLPHRPPFLLVDKIIHIDNESVAGIKSVTVNEPFFVGHFPDEPVMPGVLIVEAMAQCGGILALHGMDPDYYYSTYFLKIDNVRFKQKVVPGDVLQFELSLLEPIRRGIVNMRANAFVGDRLVCEADLMAQVAPNGKK